MELRLPEGKKPKKGDRFGFRHNLKDGTCEILWNNLNLGIIFKNLPNEIIPAMSNGRDGPCKAKIRFVEGIRKN